MIGETLVPPTQPSAPPSPYRGLVPYTEKDAEFFFGRDDDRDVVIANMKARRVTVLYGESGVGKSSLLRAGVDASLRNSARENQQRLGTPEFLPVVFSSWRDDPVAGLSAAIANVIAEFTGGEPNTTGGLAEVIEAAAKHADASLLVILDQFEDYNLYHLRDDGDGTFAHQFPIVVNRTDLPVRFLVSIREDALAPLDRFKRSIPTLWEKRICVKPLTRAAAREAIEKPLEKYNDRREKDQPEISIEPELTEQVLDQVQVGRVLLDREGRGAVNDATAHAQNGHANTNGGSPAIDAIEAPYLQLVMTRLWDSETNDRSHELRRTTLARLGGAETIVKTHLDNALAELPEAERDVAVDIFHYLVTPSGTKIAHNVETLADWTGHPAAEVQSLLDKLLKGDKRIIRPVPPPPDRDGAPSYEVFHDVLAAAILDWRTRQTNDRLERQKNDAEQRAREEHKRAQRFRLIARVAAGLFVLALVAVALAAVLWQTAASERATAQSRELAVFAEVNLGRDPELSALLALDGLHEHDTSQAEAALRDALPQIQAVRTLQAGTPVESAAFDPRDSNEVASADAHGFVWFWDVSNGRRLRRLLPASHDVSGDTADSVAFDRAGTELAVGYGSGIVILFNAHTGAELRSTNVRSAINDVVFINSNELAIATDNGIFAWLPQPGSLYPVSRALTYTVAANPTRPAEWVAATDSATVIWYVSNLRHPNSHTLWEGQSHDAQFSPAGNKVVIAYADGNGYVLDSADVANPTVVMDLDVGDALWRAAFSPDGKQIVAAYTSGVARVWDVATDLQLTTLAGHTSLVNSAQFSTDGSEIVTSSNDGTIRVWHTQPRELVTAFSSSLNSGTSEPVFSAQYSHDGSRLLTTDSSKNAYVFKDSGKPVTWHRAGTIDLGTTAVYTAQFNSTGSKIVTADSDGTVRLWHGSGDYSQISLPHPIRLQGAALGAGFSPDDSRLAIFTNQNTIQVRSAKTGLLLLPPLNAHHDLPFTVLDFRPPSGSEILTADGRGQVEVWSGATGHELRMLGTPGVAVNDVEFNHTGSRFVTAGADGIVRVWSARNDDQLLSIPACPDPNTADFSPDSSKIIVACDDGSLPVFDATTGQQLTVLRATNYGIVHTAMFSPDGNSIAIAFGASSSQGSTGGVQIWSAELATPSLPALERIAGQRISRRLTPAERHAYLAGISG